LCSKKPNKVAKLLIPFVMDNADTFMDDNNPAYAKIRDILRALATTDESIKDFVTFKDETEGIIKEIGVNVEIIKKDGKVIDNKKFSDVIKLNILDRNGNPETNAINLLRKENDRRYYNHEGLLIIKKECDEFLKQRNMKLDYNGNQWIRMCLSNELYRIIERQYYSYDNLVKVIRKINVKCINDYKIAILKDKKIPPLSYIDEGYYNKGTSIFNIREIIDFKDGQIDHGGDNEYFYFL